MEQNKSRFLQGILTGIAVAICFNVAITAVLPRLVPNTSISAKQETERKLDEITNYIDTFYVSGYDAQDLRENMYLGYVLGLGDRYSTYMDQDTFQTFMEHTEGVYAGIGATVQDGEDGWTEIVNVYDNSPAKEAGILPGDRIVEVNGLDTQYAGREAVASMMKGPDGTTVNVGVYRKATNDTYHTEITRRIISIPTVSHKMLENNIGYVAVSGFEGVTYGQFKEALEDLKSMNMEKLIIDLRNNPGGNLNTVSDMTNELVPKGVIVYTEDKNGKKEYVYSDKDYLDIPLVLLVNGNSASASEVMAGAIKDYEVGTLVGERTFGKGVVQKIFPLKDGSAVKLTTSRYYSPKGVCIHGEGIEPDFSVEMDSKLAERISDLTLEEDVQLQKAIEVLNGEKITK